MLEFNPLSPEFQANPYPYYDMLRTNAPLFHWGQWNIWFLTRYEDCAVLLKDNRLGHEILNVMTREELGLPPEPPEEYLAYTEMVRGWMLFRDPPTHTRLRSLVHKAFTPRMIERLRERIQMITDNLLDMAQDGSKMDLIADLAVPLPVTVIAEMLGVPVADQEQFRGWSLDLAGTLDLTDSPEVYDRGSRATSEFSAYLRQLAKERRVNPQEDLITALVAAEEQGDKLTESELISTCILLLVAGHETTVNLIGNGMLALLRQPEQLEKLKSNPALIGAAVEEFLRYDSPVQMTSRVVLEDMEYKGQRFQKGQQVSFMLGAANRDPEQYLSPETLDVTREANHHLAFSNGIHYCLGAPLARMEGQIAVNTLLRRLPRLRLEAENPPYRETWVLRGLRELPVSF